MTHALFRPIEGKEDIILDFIMHTHEVRAFPSASYAIRLACEEIIVNIIHYAYPDHTDGYIDITITDDGKALYITVCDGGLPFNPLERQRPDTSRNPEDRAIGGLGIFLVRQMMDHVSYSYHYGENKLTLVKKHPRKDE